MTVWVLSPVGAGLPAIGLHSSPWIQRTTLAWIAVRAMVCTMSST